MARGPIWGQCSIQYRNHRLADALAGNAGRSWGEPTIVRSSHIQAKTGIEGLGEDGVGWVQYEFREEDLI